MSYTAKPDRYDKMKYNRCGKSGLKLPAISLGIWHNFGDGDDQSTATKIITRAFDLGITHFDTANNYGPPPGSAEVSFGKLLSKELSAYRDEIIISTKAGCSMWPGPYGDWGSRKSMLASLDQSLMRMKLDYVDIFYSHRPDPETPLEETMSALADAVKNGKALYAGISNYSAKQTQEAEKILKSLGVHCIANQSQYSMLHRSIEDELLSTIKEQGIGCVAFCPLGQGLLTDKYLKSIPDDSRVVRSGVFLTRDQITEQLQAKLNKLNSIAESRGQSIAQMALSWILKDDRITTALIGASRPEQIEQNVLALEKLHFSAEHLEEINSILTEK